MPGLPSEPSFHGSSRDNAIVSRPLPFSNASDPRGLTPTNQGEKEEQSEYHLNGVDELGEVSSFTVSPPKNTLNITIIAALLKVIPASLEVSLKAEATPKSPRGIRFSPQLRMAGMKKAVPAPIKSKAITVRTIEEFSPMPTTRSKPKNSKDTLWPPP